MATTLPTDKPLPPGKEGLPFIGETAQMLLNSTFYNERLDEYGPIFRTHIMGKPTIVMSGPEAARFVLQTGMKHFSWKKGWPMTFQNLLGESLFVMDGEEHRQKRRLIMPAFHREALHRYWSVMNDLTRRYLDKWEDMGEFAWFTENKQLTFQIADVLLLGGDPDHNTAALSDQFSDLTNGFFTLPVDLPFLPYGKAMKAREALLEHIQGAIDKRKANPTQDALTLLIQTRDEDGNALTDEELRAQALLLLFAGHETTTSMITSFCRALAFNPDVWEKARAEQDALGIEGDPTIDDIKQMTYLEQVFKEVERLYPAVASGFRGVVEGFEFGDYYIPEGYQVMYSIRLTHINPDAWDDPQAFKPERFAEGKTVPYSLVGFGGGSRICIGYAFAQLEMKIIASHLLRGYTWELLNPDADMKRIPTAHPADKLMVRFSRR